jgi:hypothetical protein
MESPLNKPTSSPGDALARGGPSDALARIEAKLDRLEHRLARFDALLEQAPGMLALAGDTFDEVAGELELDTRARAAARVLERLSRPDTLARIEQLLMLSEQLPGLLALLGDSLDEFAREQGERGVDVELVMHNLGRTFDALLRLIGSEQLRGLLESDILLPGAIEALGEAARALANTQRSNPAPLGAWALLRELRDPDIQRSLGFVVDVARRFGNQARALPPAHA